MSTNAQLQPAAAATLQRWHQMIASNDLQALPELLHEQAVFRSPMAHTPYPGAPVVGLILNTVVKVFEGFTYHRELVSEDGLNVVLEFSAQVAGRELKGIDLIRFDEDGKIVETGTTGGLRQDPPQFDIAHRLAHRDVPQAAGADVSRQA